MNIGKWKRWGTNRTIRKREEFEGEKWRKRMGCEKNELIYFSFMYI